MASVQLQGLGNGVILDGYGNAQSGHQVYVYARGTTTQVQVYADAAMTVPLAQPLVTGSLGGIPGYISSAAGVPLDFYDSTAGIRVQAEPVAAIDRFPRGPSVTPEYFSSNGNGVITPGSGSGGSLTGTDDSTAFKNMLAQLQPGVLTAQGGGDVILGPRNYFLNGAPDNTYFGNAVVPIPTMGYSKAQINAIGANIPFDLPVIRFIGVPGQTRIICPRTDSYSASHGPMSIIGGPTVEGLGLTNTPPALPLRVEFHGITFVGPDQPVGGVLDLACMSSVHVNNFRVFTTTTLNFETSGNAPANLPGVASFGVRMPLSGGMESRCLIDNGMINGYGALIVAGNWTTIFDVCANFCRTVLAIDDTCNVNSPVWVNQFGSTGNLYLVAGFDPANGVKSLTTNTTSNLRAVAGYMSNYAWASPFAPVANFLDANGLIGGDMAIYEWPTVFSYNGQLNTSGKSTKMRVRSMTQEVVTGTATLSGGTVTVSATSVGANTRVRCGILTPGGTVGSPFCSSKTAGTGFTIKSTSASDTSVVWWEMTDP